VAEDLSARHWSPRAAGGHVQRRGHAAAAAGAGREPGHGGIPADVRAGEHDVRGCYASL
jgi:hypothetical protein